MDQLYCCNNAGVAEGSEVEGWFRLYSLYPTVQVAIISSTNVNSSSDCLTPHKMMHLANQAVREFKLNLSQVIWIEHIPAKCGNPSCADFNLINFDWHAGQATSPHRSPISEDWYLSWLELSDELDSTVPFHNLM